MAASLSGSDGRMPSAARLTLGSASATAIFITSSMFDTLSAWSARNEAARTLNDVSLRSWASRTGAAPCDAKAPGRIGQRDLHAPARSPSDDACMSRRIAACAAAASRGFAWPR